MSVSPSVDSPTDTPFTVVCDVGYTSGFIGGVGNMECTDAGIWSNEPSCDGVYTQTRSLIARHHILKDIEQLSGYVVQTVRCPSARHRTMVVHMFLIT